MVDDKAEQEEQEERSKNILNAGIEARTLLDHPMMVSFFNVQTLAAVNTFTNLPDDASLNDYKAVHMRLKAFHALKSELERHIINAQHEQLKLKNISEGEYDKI